MTHAGEVLIDVEDDGDGPLGPTRTLLDGYGVEPARLTLVEPGTVRPTPDALAAHIQREIPKWAKVVKAANVHIE